MIEYEINIKKLDADEWRNTSITQQTNDYGNRRF